MNTQSKKEDLVETGRIEAAKVHSMRQVSPYPAILLELVEQLKYKPGWKFSLGDLDRGQGSQGLTLTIRVISPDSNNPEQNITVLHYMIVPPAAYDERAWMRWLFDQILLVETHEAGEYFRIGQRKPFGPHHQPGQNPYSVIEVGTEQEARVNYKGEVEDDAA